MGELEVELRGQRTSDVKNMMKERVAGEAEKVLS